MRVISSPEALAATVLTILMRDALPVTKEDDVRWDQAQRLIGRWRAIQTSEEWWADLYFPNEVEFYADETYTVLHGPWSGQMWHVWKPGEIDVRMKLQYVTFAFRFEGDELVMSLPSGMCYKRYRRLEREGKPVAEGDRLRQLLDLMDLWDDDTELRVEMLLEEARPWRDGAKALLHQLLDVESLWSPEARNLLRQLQVFDDLWYEAVEMFLEDLLGPEESWDEATRLRVEVYRPLLLDDLWDDEVQALWGEVLGGPGPLSRQIQMVLQRAINVDVEDRDEDA